MKKIKSILIILAISFLLVGCEFESPDEEDEMRIGSSYIGGSGELEISFMENRPPSEILDSGETSFDISLQLKNEGESDVTQAAAKIEGVNPSVLTGTDADYLIETLDDSIRGRQLREGGDEEPGDISYIEFEDLGYHESVSTNIPLNLRARLCYNYGANALVTDFCVKRNPLDISDGACEVSGAKDVDSSSAPVSVRNFEQRPLSNDRIRMSFDVVHQSSGEIINPEVNVNADCFDVERSDRNKVEVKIVGAGQGNIDCGDNFEVDGNDKIGFVSLYGGDRTSVRCEYTTDESTSERGTEDTIQIALDYNYRVSDQKTIMLRDSGN